MNGIAEMQRRADRVVTQFEERVFFLPPHAREALIKSIFAALVEQDAATRAPGNR
jgi:hypothetical protein